MLHSFLPHLNVLIHVACFLPQVCEYKIECSDPAPDSVGLFPGCSDASWGPDTFVNQFGLTPVNRAAILLAPDGHAEVSFDRKGDVRVYARLVRDGVEEGELKQAVLVKNDANKVESSSISSLHTQRATLWRFGYYILLRH